MTSEKDLVRKQMQTLRSEIKPEKREQAELSALNTLKVFFETFTFVLSYSSFKDEFSTERINAYLLLKQKLFLPFVDDDHLEPYFIENPETQLKKNLYGFMEPIPEKCKKGNLNKATLILVPGLAFDEKCHRLGYGKGYYDRFLSSRPNHWKCYGLGFQCQLQEKLPSTELDVSLDGVFLF